MNKLIKRNILHLHRTGWVRGFSNTSQDDEREENKNLEARMNQLHVKPVISPEPGLNASNLLFRARTLEDDETKSYIKQSSFQRIFEIIDSNPEISAKEMVKKGAEMNLSEEELSSFKKKYFLAKPEN
eukprot:maker-scaffold_7-snap-gene-19.86-mRNA-1 protein AED:0.00 eAED:0.00 QI:27/1/1/1/1/1/2/171/127